MKVYEGNFLGKDKKFMILVSRFNEFISKRLLEGCVDMLKRHEVDEKNIDVAWVPGSFELPYVAKKIAKDKKYDAIICLGAVIKGGTPHNEYIASEVTKGIASVSMETGVPVVFGVLTPDNLEQAIERAGAKEGNKGAQAGLTALEMVNLYDELKI